MKKEALFCALLFMPITFATAQNTATDWDDAQKKLIQEMTTKYGEPDGETDSRIVWTNPEGQFEEIIIFRNKVDHDFPVAHKDYLEQAVYHNVPADKMDELAAFDGSIIVYRTEGRLAARCDKEGANILALNLAHDIIMNDKSVEQARQEYAQAVQQMMAGNTPETMKSLAFESMAPAAASFSDVAAAQSGRPGQQEAAGAGRAGAQPGQDRSPADPQTPASDRGARQNQTTSDRPQSDPDNR